MTFDLTETEDQRQIRDAAGAMLREHYPLSRLDAEPKPDNLAALFEFGAFALALPEADGGAGFSLVEEALLHVQLGRHLVSPGALATPVAARVDVDGAALLDARQKVAAGIAVADSILLLDGASAKMVVLRDGAALHLLHMGEAPREAVRGMGHGRPLQRIARGFVPELEVAISEVVAATWQVLVSAQLLGVAEAARDLAVEYALAREQFGRPIGSFQAIQHRCADMAVRTEQLSALIDMAAISLRDGREEAAFQTAALARLAPATALENARACIQIHGGIGFSAEAHPHLYLKHAHALAQLLLPDDILVHAAPMAPTTKDA